MITESPEIFLKDFGLTTVFGTISGFGLFESPDEVIGNYAMSTEYSVTVLNSLFGAIDNGDDITVNGISYKVRGAPKKLDDGVFLKITLTKP